MSHKHKKIGSEAGMSIAVILVLGLLVHPYWMPMGLIVICIAVLAVLVFGLGVFVWRENPRDEREYQAVALSGRLAYLVGAGIMTVGVTIQTIQHRLDGWLLGALAVMLLAKIISRSSAD